MKDPQLRRAVRILQPKGQNHKKMDKFRVVSGPPFNRTRRAVAFCGRSSLISTAQSKGNKRSRRKRRATILNKESSFRPRLILLAEGRDFWAWLDTTMPHSCSCECPFGLGRRRDEKGVVSYQTMQGPSVCCFQWSLCRHGPNCRTHMWSEKE